jgi:hypothetical protein
VGGGAPFKPLPAMKHSLLLACAAALPLLAWCRNQNMNSVTSERPLYVNSNNEPVTEPTPVYVSLSVMFLGDISEPESAFSLDGFVDVAWRDDRLGPNSPQPFGCTPNTVAVMLLMESFVPSYCKETCSPIYGEGEKWCGGGYAVAAPWSPFLEVTNVAPKFSGSALTYPIAYTSAGAPPRLKLNDTSGTWVTATSRFSGPILKVYPLQNFPYDKQLLEITFESSQWANSDVVLIPTYDPSEVRNTILSSRSMLGWDVEDISLRVDDNVYTQLSVSYSRIVMSVKVTRQSYPYGQRYIMPGFFIIIMMLCASIHAEGAVRVANGVAGFASILYLQFILTSSVPPLNYFTRLDSYMLISLIICFLSCLVGGVHVYREVAVKAAKDAEGEAKRVADGADGAVLQVREPASAPARSLLQVCLARRNPFSGESVADCVCYGVIFAAYSIASACVLLA